MTKDEILAQLESLGTSQNRKIYMRHGSGPNTFGVSFANLNKLAKSIGRNQELASGLWQSGNSDARALALMIAESEKMTPSLAENWLGSTNYSLLLGMLAGLVAKSDFARDMLVNWTSSKNEGKKTCGFNLLSHLLKEGVHLEQEAVQGYLEKIEMEIHDSPNQARAAMNNALIAIGTYSEALLEKALESARAIGKVQVDHGETSCKTPDALTYIKKAVAHRQKRI